MGKKVKVLLLVKVIDAGVGTFVFQMLRLREDFDIVVGSLERQKYTAPTKTANKIYYFSDTLKYARYYGPNPLLLVHFLKEIIWLFRIIKKEKPQVILSIDIHLNLLSGIIKALTREDTKLIFTTHINLPAVIRRKLFPPLRKPLELIGNYFYSRADAVVCVSEGVSGAIKKLFSLKRRIITIPYGLDSKSVITKSKEKILKDEGRVFTKDAKRIISIGRFDAQKDFVTLIRAFVHVKREIKNADLVLLGDGYQRREFEKKVKDLKIAPYVHFLGWKSNVYPYIKRSDVFVLSSRYEGFGYVLIEAMFLGLPVISTDAPFGPREVLGDGKYGILVPIGNVKVLAEAIIKLLQDKKEYRRYALMSRQRIKFYTEEKMLASYKNLISALLKSRN